MSTKHDNERLIQKVQQLDADLKEARGDAASHLANLERMAAKAARTERAEAALARTHADRAKAWQQVAQRDAVIRELTEQRDTAIAAIEAMAVEDRAAGSTS